MTIILAKVRVRAIGQQAGWAIQMAPAENRFTQIPPPDKILTARTVSEFEPC